MNKFPLLEKSATGLSDRKIIGAVAKREMRGDSLFQKIVDVGMSGPMERHIAASTLKERTPKIGRNKAIKELVESTQSRNPVPGRHPRKQEWHGKMANLITKMITG